MTIPALNGVGIFLPYCLKDINKKTPFQHNPEAQTPFQIALLSFTRSGGDIPYRARQYCRLKLKIKEYVKSNIKYRI